MGMNRSQALLEARRLLLEGLPPVPGRPTSDAAEGGCGVTGFACSIPVGGKHIYEPSRQMRNRGNGKGGGIAAAGLVASEMGVSQKLLDEDYILQIALLDPTAKGAVEREFIEPFFDIHAGYVVPTVDDYRSIELLETKPPDVARYFVRVKPRVLDEFTATRRLQSLSAREAEDEFVYQNSFALNQRFYASLGEKQAFVMSHARNLIILKIVGYAEQVVQYYGMEETRAHIWIAHQRYPTKGRVWHPGGAHPFIGLNEALVHNGDFANYHSVTEYLAARHIRPQFLTDTEVSVLLFDLWNRVCGYPVEYIIEALAPTTELDFDRLPEEKQRIYRQIQAAHIHGSPDGPWFFIIARSLPETNQLQLLGITDTAMLRPQVFALQEGEVTIGLVCSEKQAIDATLHSLASEDKRFCRVADTYWNARGGSHNDGGAFMFTLTRDAGARGNGNGSGNGRELPLVCTDKFGKLVRTPAGRAVCDITTQITPPANANAERERVDAVLREGDAKGLFAFFIESLSGGYDRVRWLAEAVVECATDDTRRAAAIEALTLAIDRRYDTGAARRSWVLHIVQSALHRVFDGVPLLGELGAGRYRRITQAAREMLRAPAPGEVVLVSDARGGPPEGIESESTMLVEAYRLGWRRFVSYRIRGQRFYGCGLGPATRGVRFDLYDNPGDYIASGIDGMELHVHCNAQDQVGQIVKSGKLVIHGDVGQTFLYGAKGGEIYVLGNAAGRPLINAVGRPRVVINGTCLEFLAESFMAGNPLEGGGFVILNGMMFDASGRMVEQPLPYPGSNLFSLASGGAIYVRDPRRRLIDAQLNGGRYADLTPADWRLILPYLEENERLFGISIERDLLVVDGETREPHEVYRKVVPASSQDQEADFEALAE
jgi:glutamate synthase domain-containing protein 1/glutamate synthase domain-containing protein 3